MTCEVSSLEEIRLFPVIAAAPSCVLPQADAARPATATAAAIFTQVRDMTIFILILSAPVPAHRAPR